MAEGPKSKRLTTKKRHKNKTFIKESSLPTSVSAVPNLDTEKEKIVITSLKELFSCHKVRKPHRKDKNSPGALSSMLVGINAVTRSIEKSNASVVFISGCTRPTVLVDHIYVMAYQKRLAVPIVTLRDSRPLLADLNLTSLNAFAFKRLNEYDDGYRSSLIKIIDTLPDEVFEHCSRSTVLNNRSAEELTNQPTTEEPLKKEAELEEVPLPSLQDIFHEKCELDITLPPDDVPFSSLYIFAGDEEKDSSTPDFLSFTADSYDIKPTRAHLRKRYHKLETGVVKYDPRRNKIKKTKNS